MKWPQIVMVVCGVIAVAVAVRMRPDKPVAPPSIAEAPPAAAATGQILPPALERPGVASRLIGVMRTYVAVAEEVRLEPSADGPAIRVASLPILIVLENETYRPLTVAAVGWIGNSLCTVRVSRMPDAGGEVEVYQAEVPLPARADWLSAERRSFSVDWPLTDRGSFPSGNYKVSVRLALPEEPAVEIYTRLL
jgi:hypothetical protein